MKKRNRKALAVICCSGLLAVVGAGMALAQSPTLVAGGVKTENAGGPSAGKEDVVMDMYQIWGPVLSVSEGQIRIDNQSDVSFKGEIVLNISDEYSRVLDAENGFPIQMSDIQVGETIYAYIGPAMTMSLPPMTTAQMIIGKIPADFKAPSYVQVKTMTWQENGDWVLTTEAGETYQVPGNCPIIPYLTRNLVTLQDVTGSSKLLVWSDAQNNAQKLVLFAEDVQ